MGNGDMGNGDLGRPESHSDNPWGPTRPTAASFDSAEAPLTSPPARPPGHGFRSTLLAGGAAVGMILAGLAVASAQTDGTPTTTASQPQVTTTVPGGTADEEIRHRKHHGMRVGARLDVAAQAIGISEEELVTALRAGQSIAQVAQSKNVDPQKVIDAIVVDARTKLAAKVQSGDLTQAQADERLANLTTRVTEMVSHAGLGGPGRPGGPGGHRFGPGGDGPDDGPPDVQQAPPTTAS